MKTTSSLRARLEQDATKWCEYLKLSPDLCALIPQLRLDNIFKVWSDWRQGKRHRQIAVERLDDSTHGVTRVRGGKVTSVAVTDVDELERQLLTVVHELIHVFAHPYRPDHRDLHTLAAGLAYNVFPRYAQGGANMGNDLMDELEVLNDFDDQDNGDEEAVLNDELSDETTDGEAFDLYRRRKSALSRIKKFMPHQQLLGIGRGRRIKKEKNAGLPALAIQKSYGGWILPYFRRLFEAQALAVPRRGITRMTPEFNIYGWKSGSYDAWFNQLMNSLSAGDGRTVKGFGKATMGGGPTTVVLTPLVRSVGLIVKIADSLLNNTGETVRIAMFDQAGATVQSWLVDLEPHVGTSEFICLYAENDRGSGVPTARNDQQFTIAAAGLVATARLSAESINLREIEA